MPVVVKRLNGFLNSDDRQDVLPAPHHAMAFNGRFRGNPGDMVFENVEGTTKITNSALPAGTNRIIGIYHDQLKNRVIYFNWNSNARHGIYQYNFGTKILSKLLVCFTDSQSDILNFDLEYPIASVNILYRTDADGDILHWITRNNRPMKLNLLDAENGRYGTAWLVDYLTVARQQPLLAPTATYKDDNTVTLNNLRNKMYLFRYRYIYTDDTKSTWSPFCKLFSPFNPDDISNNIDEQKNNRIDVTVNTGNKDVTKIEIGAANSLASTFSDLFSIVILDKAALSINDNSQYVYNFFNDGLYSTVDVAGTDLLFSLVPYRANCQEILNGNILAYGGITEGYDFNTTMDVTTGVALQNFASSNAPFTVSSISNGQIASYPDFVEGTYTLFVAGVPAVGDVYSFYIEADADSNYAFPGFTVTYTVGAGEDLATVITNIVALLMATADFVNNWPDYTSPPVSPWVPGTSGIKWTAIGNLNPGTTASGFIQLSTTYSPYRIQVTPTITYASAPTNFDGVANSIYKHASRYGFAIAYFDEFGVTDGAHTIDTMSIVTPSTFNLTATPQIPAISFSINHQPPIWAKSFSFLRTKNQSVDTNTIAIAYDSKKDSSSKYVYLRITSLQTNNANLPVYEFKAGDRVRLVYYRDSGLGANVALNKDYPVLDLVEDPKIDNVTETGTFLKLPYDTSLSVIGTSPAYYVYCDIYTPAKHETAEDLEYYEFGETYNVLNPGLSTRAHDGQIQSQIVGTGARPATFTFIRGDFYMKYATYFVQYNVTDIFVSAWFVDRNVSYLFPSKLTGNGRALLVDKDAKQTYYPTSWRWGGEYEQNTSVNNTNIFYPADVDEVDRQKGDIQRLKVRDRIMRVFQNRGCGQIGIYTKFIQDNAGQSTLASTNGVITTNNIQYYLGEYGIGDQYTGLASSQRADYFVDPIRGVQVRLSNDGITPLSELYKGWFYIGALLNKYADNYQTASNVKARIFATFNFLEKEAVFTLQAGTLGSASISDYTFTFNEDRNAYSNFYNFYPDQMLSANADFFSWKDGEMYIHDDTTHCCKFYGTQFYPSITLVCNDQAYIKKRFLYMGYQSNAYWTAATTGDISTQFINPQTSFRQQSQLKNVDFSIQENVYSGAFLRDANSQTNPAIALLEGDYLQGTWLEIKLTAETILPTYLYGVYFHTIVSNKNL